jgi:hypothetical protein
MVWYGMVWYGIRALMDNVDNTHAHPKIQTYTKYMHAIYIYNYIYIYINKQANELLPICTYIIASLLLMLCSICLSL